mgnify:CR=1 FL=1
MKLRPYQEAALSATVDAFASGKQRVLVVKPTGTGKTVLFAALVARVAQGVRSRGGAPGRSLVLAHREELVRQAREKIVSSARLRCGVEMADERADRLDPPPVVVASVQSMQRARLASYAPDHFDLVVVDEAHHATAPTYGAIFDAALEANAELRVAGFTATPFRAGDVRHSQADISKAAATRALESTIGAVKTTLKKGGTVSLVGFGTFAVGKRAARTGRNPRTGAAIKIKAAKVPKFRPGKALKDALN